MFPQWSVPSLFVYATFACNILHEMKVKFCVCYLLKNRFERPGFILILAVKNMVKSLSINTITAHIFLLFVLLSILAIFLEKTRYTLVALHECGLQAMIEPCSRRNSETWHYVRKQHIRYKLIIYFSSYLFYVVFFLLLLVFFFFFCYLSPCVNSHYKAHHY